MNDTIEPGCTFPDMHPELLAACIRLGIKPEQVSTRCSDVLILCATHEQAHNIKLAGNWRSMAEVFRTNIGHPDAAKWPWGVNVPLACIGAYIASKTKSP